MLNEHCLDDDTPPQPGKSASGATTSLQVPQAAAAPFTRELRPSTINARVTPKTSSGSKRPRADTQSDSQSSKKARPEPIITKLDPASQSALYALEMMMKNASTKLVLGTIIKGALQETF